MTTLLRGQTANVSGLITDKENNPILGANILIENTLLGTAADEHGEFLITNVPIGNNTITVSAVGYAKKSLNVLLRMGSYLLPLVTADFKLSGTIACGTPPKYWRQLFIDPIKSSNF